MVMQTQLRPLSQPVDYDDSELPLIKAWSHEFLHLAMMSAFVGMGCNAAARDNRVSGLRQIEPNLPEAPAIYRATRQGLLELPQRYAPALLAAQTAYGAVAIAINDFNNVQALHEKWAMCCRRFSNTWQAIGAVRPYHCSKRSMCLMIVACCAPAVRLEPRSTLSFPCASSSC